MGRVARAVAARTHLSLDRFSDLYLVADAVADLAVSEASAPGISFAVAAAHKRLELTVGPLRSENGARILERGLIDRAGTALTPVLGEFALEPVEDHELLRVVLEERREG
jgi:hypothetical protein